MKGFKFSLLKTVGLARAGELLTPHGIVETPVFMPVGTQGTVKAVAPEDLEAMKANIILGNTYHLYLRPGSELIESLGGLHSFMGWGRPILTDSGGYQVSSLGTFKREGMRTLSTVDEDGVTFKSHLDGSTHRFTPEKAVEIQEQLGSDVLMAFDEATPELGREYAAQSMERTHRWLVRSRKRWLELEEQKEGIKPTQALFGIIQGGDYEDLRRESTTFVLEQKLPGIALGGATIGQSPEETERNASYVRSLLPSHLPRYFMGVGVNPTHAIAAVKSGADMFDCVAPTKLARTGLLYQGRLVVPNQDPMKAYFESEYPNERIVIEKAEFVRDQRPIDEACDCYTCQHGFSRAYLRHLFRAKELLFYRLASIHNLRMMLRSVQGMRSAILASTS